MPELAEALDSLGKSDYDLIVLTQAFLMDMLPIRNQAFNRLKSLAGKVKPATHSVYIRTLLNGWPTGRRMRTLNSMHRSTSCPFCSTGQDSIEHFAHCQWCKEVFMKFNVTCNSLLDFLCLDSACTCDRVLVAKAKVLAILFTIRSTLVHHPSSAPPLDKDVLLRTAIGGISCSL